ncbi:MAG: hypothetical protein K8S55_07365 [Phycisphaerae bacterium]|nr:hypothetical protein [Phycisphaerae bacterium]
MDMSICTFQQDVTPPIGSPLCHGAVPPAAKIVDPLSARGLVIFGAGQPIVLCAVDWVCISSASHDMWRTVLAEAAGTTADRVTVHTLHPHDTPGTDMMAAELLAEHGLAGCMFDVDFERKAVAGVAESLKKSLDHRQPVTHLSMGKARVEKFASNRRILGNDGKVKHVRFSSCGYEHVRGMDEGVIDPFVRSLVLWDQEQPLVALSYYASHPQSFYRRGAVSYDTVGLARGLREATLPETAHIHFCGAGGNVAAGKYNDGSPGNRFLLAERLADGMARAWDNGVKIPLSAQDIDWQSQPVSLPLNPQLAKNLDEFKAILVDDGKSEAERINAARKICYVEQMTAGRKFDISCLKLGPARILHMPGELFVEYQLAAQDMRPGEMVCMAAYGDSSPAYIGTEIAYEQGGYECGPNTARVAPETEHILMRVMRELME